MVQLQKAWQRLVSACSKNATVEKRQFFLSKPSPMTCLHDLQTFLLNPPHPYLAPPSLPLRECGTPTIPPPFSAHTAAYPECTSRIAPPSFFSFSLEPPSHPNLPPHLSFRRAEGKRERVESYRGRRPDSFPPLPRKDTQLQGGPKTTETLYNIITHYFLKCNG